MLKKISFFSVFSAVMLSAQITTQESDFVKSVIPSTKVEKIEKSKIDGLYEAYLMNGQVLYVHPFSKMVIFGELWTTAGQNITAQNRERWMQDIENKQLQNISITELLQDTVEVKYGSGSKNLKIVLFTDPECSFCKNAEKFLSTKDITVQYSFLPLPFHKNAEKWSLYALSSNDFKQSLLDIENGKNDDNLKITNTAKEQLEKMRIKASKLNVTGTPKMYVIKNNKIISVINGADISKIEKALKEDE